MKITLRPGRLLASLLLLALSLAATAAERTVYFVNDAQGSPVAAMDQQGEVLWRENYAPYGERRTKTTDNNGKPAYTGKPEDTDTSLVYMHARMYDPETARFTGIDPQGYSEANPQSFGRYLYANNAPYRYTDPDGESPIDVGFLLYDVGVFSAAVYRGDGIGAAATDLAIDLVGMASPVPGTGQYIKGVRGAHKGYEAEMAATKIVAPAKRDSGETVLGKYPAYVYVSEAHGARRFQIPMDQWRRMSPEQQWEANKKFLDRTIAKGDRISLASPAGEATGAFKKEIDYLVSKGYKVADGGLRMEKSE